MPSRSITATCSSADHIGTRGKPSGWSIPAVASASRYRIGKEVGVDVDQRHAAILRVGAYDGRVQPIVREASSSDDATMDAIAREGDASADAGLPRARPVAAGTTCSSPRSDDRVVAYGGVVDVDGVTMLTDLFVAAELAWCGHRHAVVGSAVRWIEPADDVQLEAPRRARRVPAGRNGTAVAAALPQGCGERRRHRIAGGAMAARSPVAGRADGVARCPRVCRRRVDAGRRRESGSPACRRRDR